MVSEWWALESEQEQMLERGGSGQPKGAKARAKNNPGDPRLISLPDTLHDCSTSEQN